MERKLAFPDWSEDRISLPGEGSVPPEYSFTFFPNPNEAKALRETTPEVLAKTIRKQTGMTSRFLHEAIATGRVAVAQEAVQLLGGPGTAIDFVDQDWHRALCEMAFDFVPEVEVQRTIKAFHELGFADLTDTRTNIPRVKSKRQQEVEQQKPSREELLAYADKYNQGQLSRRSSLRYTDDLRIIDPRRGLRYVGLGNTRDYDWVDISADRGFKRTAHYTAPDEKTKIALLSVY